MTSVLFHSFRSSSALHKFSKIIANGSKMSLFCSLSTLRGISSSLAGFKIFYLSYHSSLYSLPLSLILIILASWLRLTLPVKKSKKGISLFNTISNCPFSPLSIGSLFPLSLSCYRCIIRIHLFCLAIYPILCLDFSDFAIILHCCVILLHSSVI